jgi:TRAP-type mannitol/chloroaromatic compound transport system substrate-binding protein
MRRRDFLKTTGAAAAAATSATGAAAAHIGLIDAPKRADTAAPAVVKGLQELRLAMPWADAAAGPADQAHRLAQRITAMSEGRYRITFAPGTANGMAAVRAGEADLYFASEHDHLDAHRVLAYFAGLPGNRGLEPRHLAAWMLVGGAQDLWDDIAGDFGVKAMLAGHTGGEARFVATKRIESMSELAGTSASVAGLARDVVRGIGLEAAALAPAQIAGALSRGEVLAAEVGGALTSHAMGVSAAAPYATGTAINRHGAALSLGLRRDFWDGLSPTDQTIFATAAAAELQLAIAEDETHRRMLAPTPSAADTWPLSADLARAINRVADAVVAHVAAADAPAQRVNAAHVGFRRIALGEDAPTGGVGV